MILSDMQIFAIPTNWITPLKVLKKVFYLQKRFNLTHHRVCVLNRDPYRYKMREIALVLSFCINQTQLLPTKPTYNPKKSTNLNSPEKGGVKSDLELTFVQVNCEKKFCDLKMRLKRLIPTIDTIPPTLIARIKAHNRRNWLSFSNNHLKWSLLFNAILRVQQQQRNNPRPNFF